MTNVIRRTWNPAAADRLALLLTAAGLAAGGIAYLAGNKAAADVAWAATTLLALLPLLYSVVCGLLRRKAGVDFIATDQYEDLAAVMK